MTLALEAGTSYARSCFIVANEGPGSIVDFLIEFAITNDFDCPWQPYLGSADCGVDPGGFIVNANIGFLSDGCPTIAAGSSGSVNLAGSSLAFHYFACC